MQGWGCGDVMWAFFEVIGAVGCGWVELLGSRAIVVLRSCEGKGGGKVCVDRRDGWGLESWW